MLLYFCFLQVGSTSPGTNVWPNQALSQPYSSFLAKCQDQIHFHNCTIITKTTRKYEEKNSAAEISWQWQLQYNSRLQTVIIEETRQPRKLR